MRRGLFIGLFYCITVASEAQNIYTFAGNGSSSGPIGDGGSALIAVLRPFSLVADPSGNIYISSSNRIRVVNALGTINTFAGTTTGWFGDGGPATSAGLNNPFGMAFDAFGNMYIADESNQKIRKINTSGIISTIAGLSVGYGGDGGPATSAQLHSPSSVAIDAIGNIYIADYLNNRIRKIDTSGIITTIAGTGVNGYSGDGGPASLAQLNGPTDIKIYSGAIYFSDSFNYRIRKIDSSGIISTVAGTGTNGYSGDGGPATSAQIGRPVGIAFDGSGNLYMTDDWNNTIRKVNTTGTITTIVGGLGTGYSGDGGLASLAMINGPEGILIDSAGNLYFADTGNNRVRTICFSTCVLGYEGISVTTEVKIYPNPVSSFINIQPNQNNFQSSVLEITNTLGQTVLKQFFSEQIDVSELIAGVYILKIASEGHSLYHKFVKE